MKRNQISLTCNDLHPGGMTGDDHAILDINIRQHTGSNKRTFGIESGYRVWRSDYMTLVDNPCTIEGLECVPELGSL